MYFNFYKENKFGPCWKVEFPEKNTQTSEAQAWLLFQHGKLLGDLYSIWYGPSILKRDRVQITVSYVEETATILTMDLLTAT